MPLSHSLCLSVCLCLPLTLSRSQKTDTEHRNRTRASESASGRAPQAGERTAQEAAHTEQKDGSGTSPWRELREATPAKQRSPISAGSPEPSVPSTPSSSGHRRRTFPFCTGVIGTSLGSSRDRLSGSVQLLPTARKRAGHHKGEAEREEKRRNQAWKNKIPLPCAESVVQDWLYS